MLTSCMMLLAAQHAHRLHANFTHWIARLGSVQCKGKTQIMMQRCDSIAQAHRQASADKAALQAHMTSSLQAKDAEIQGLLANRGRLDAALAAIKGQITSAVSPARADPTQSKSLVRASLDSHTLRCATCVVAGFCTLHAPQAQLHDAKLDCVTGLYVLMQQTLFWGTGHSGMR